MKKIMIGFVDDTACDSKTTQQQIDDCMKLTLNLIDPEEGKPISWLDVNNPDEPRTIFQAILADRRTRIDNHTCLCDRPMFAMLSVDVGEVVRLEFYEGHDYLECTYDLRSKKLTDADIPKSYLQG